MQWFKRPRQYVPVRHATRRKNIPDGLWKKCDKCEEILYVPELERRMHVCPQCGYHFRIGARLRIKLIVDEGSFEETHADMTAGDPLNFETPLGSYPEKLEENKKATDLMDAAICGFGEIETIPISLAVTDSFFMMGSMGSVVGEKVTIAAETAIDKKLPLITVSGSGGGARMQEGMVSLMQMAKTSAAVRRMADTRLPFISVLTDPTMGGVAASFSFLGDVIIAEPGAVIGFAGPRVVQQTIHEEPPADFQSAESQMKYGFVDMVVARDELKHTIAHLLRLLM
jgi:acetyl-CoA carboxylase carboxyl transferase subunit beta